MLIGCENWQKKRKATPARPMAGRSSRPTQGTRRRLRIFNEKTKTKRKTQSPRRQGSVLGSFDAAGERIGSANPIDLRPRPAGRPTNDVAVSASYNRDASYGTDGRPLIGWRRLRYRRPPVSQG